MPTIDRNASMSKLSDLKVSLLNDDNNSDFHTVIEFDQAPTQPNRHRLSALGLERPKINNEPPLPKVSEALQEEITCANGEGESYSEKNLTP